jgi:membrane protein involved in colicin uptake
MAEAKKAATKKAAPKKAAAKKAAPKKVAAKKAAPKKPAAKKTAAKKTTAAKAVATRRSRGGTLTGTVTSRSNNQPIKGATLVFSPNGSCQTDQTTGVYRKSLNAGTYYPQISGYINPQPASVQVPATGVKQQDISFA